MLFSDGLLSYNVWLALPSEVRHKLITLFDIPRSGNTTVEYRATGPVVTSDGFTPADLGAVSLSRMQGLLGSDSDNFYKLFEQVVNNLDDLLGGTLKAKSGETIAAEDITPDEHLVIDRSTFCDQCTSKGGRHLKTCPKRNEKSLSKKAE
jgi:hypothetical protein